MHQKDNESLENSGLLGPNVSPNHFKETQCLHLQVSNTPRRLPDPECEGTTDISELLHNFTVVEFGGKKN
jgi:hypothetical protein